MSLESSHTLPLGALLAGLLLFGLATATAAGPSGPMGSLPGRVWPALGGKNKTAQPEPGAGRDHARRQIPAAARTNAKTAMPEASAFESLKGTVGMMDRQTALRVSRGGDEFPGFLGIILFGDLSPGSVVVTLVLLFCVLTLLGTAYWARKLYR